MLVLLLIFAFKETMGIHTYSYVPYLQQSMMDYRDENLHTIVDYILYKKILT